MTVTSQHGSSSTLWHGLRAAALTGAAALLVAACGGDTDCTSPPAFEGEAVGSCAGSESETVNVASLSIVMTNESGAPAASLANNGTDRITATVTALNASNAVVEGASVRFSVTTAEVAPSATTTDALGRISASVGIGPNRANRTVTVTATASNGVSTSTTFLVTGASLTATVPPVAAPGTRVTVNYTLEDNSGNPMVNESVTVTGNGNSLGSGTTDLTGRTSISFDVPASTGSFPIIATAAGVDLANSILVQTSSVPAATLTVDAASVAANPSVVGISSAGSTVRALFRAANNAPVKNVRVWFTLPDPNNVGGSFTNGGIVYSDDTGTAQTTFVPGSVASPTNGVTLLACYSNKDFVVPTTAGTCPATASDGSPIKQTTATLTVVDQALRISIGTNEFIDTSSNLTYKKDYVVVVVDSAGNAKAGVEITPSLDLVAFYKGFYEWDGSKWARNGTDGVLQLPSCVNEDINRNGFAEQGEDLNGNGELDPAGVSITMVNGSKTDSSGKATVRIEYPRDRGSWIDYVITVTGKVGGSEGSAVFQGVRGGRGSLPVSGDALTTEVPPPAFVVSPYGRLPGCDNTN